MDERLAAVNCNTARITLCNCKACNQKHARLVAGTAILKANTANLEVEVTCRAFSLQECNSNTARLAIN